MKFTAERENLLAALQAAIGVVERRQTMPILANVLLSAKDGTIAITATDLEGELVAHAAGHLQIAAGEGDHPLRPGRGARGHPGRQEPFHAVDAARRGVSGG